MHLQWLRIGDQLIGTGYRKLHFVHNIGTDKNRRIIQETKIIGNFLEILKLGKVRVLGRFPPDPLYLIPDSLVKLKNSLSSSSSPFSFVGSKYFDLSTSLLRICNTNLCVDS